MDLTLGGRPRFLGVVGTDASAAADAPVNDFLFLLPFGRPRPLFTGVAVEVPAKK
jgi:lipid-binding SYLF domain-containing protein